MQQGHEHEDYLAAPHALRYRGGQLRLLFMMLSEQSEPRPAGVWSSRILPNGALVAMTRTPEGHRILRISRKSGFKTERGPELWNNELHTFVTKFGCALWYRVDEKDAPGVAVRFHEVAPGPRCRCGMLMDPVALAAMAEECTVCAFKRKHPPVGQADVFDSARNT